jgi:hypothetical protein
VDSHAGYIGKNIEIFLGENNFHFPIEKKSHCSAIRHCCPVVILQKLHKEDFEMIA